MKLNVDVRTLQNFRNMNKNLVNGCQGIETFNMDIIGWVIAYMKYLFVVCNNMLNIYMWMTFGVN